MRVYSDASFTNLIQESTLNPIANTVLSNKSGYYKAVFYTSSFNTIPGFDASYPNELIVKPIPVITSAPNIIGNNLVYGISSILTASTTARSINPWEININSYIGITNNADLNKLNIEAILVGGPTEIKYTDEFGCNVALSLNVIKATPTISINNSSLTYNATTQAVQITPSTPGSFSNTLYNGNTYSSGPVDAGVYSITTNFTPDDVINYNSLINSNVGNFIINKAQVTISNIILTKVYDGNPNVTSITNSVTGIISADNVVVSAVGTNFSDKDVAINYTSTVTFSLITSPATGKENNYFIFGGNDVFITNGSITAKSITVGATATNKEYDGTRAAAVSLTDDRISGDVLTVDKTSSLFDTKDAGTGKVVTVSGITVTGTDAGNYSLTTTSATTSAEITAKSITVGATATNKEYDGTRAAAVSLTDDRISGDVLTVDKTSSLFDTKDAGTGKVVTVSGITVTGTDAGNYSLTTTSATTSAEITAKSITVGATATNKEYDGTRAAAVSLTDDRISGDVLTVDKTSSLFDTKDAGTGKVVTVSGITVTGTDAGNYSLTSTTATTTADITPKSITVTGLTTSNKVYDRTNIAILTGGSLVGVISPDVVNFSASGTFSQTNVGTGISITSTSTIDNSNYILTQPVLTARDITAKPLTVTGVLTANKVYDRTNVATLTGGALVGVISPDVVNLTQSGNYAQYKVGASIPITSTSMIDNANYELLQPTLIARDITPKVLMINAVADDKLFDGNKNATVTLSTTDLIGGDVITLPYTLAEFDSPLVGTNKLVTVSGINIGGIDAGNYSLTTTFVTTNASITAPPVIIFELPNAFTPNGDGKNDELKVISNAGVTELKSFKIFSRAGNLVFESRDLSKGWDGRYNGNLLPIDIYYWTAVYVDRNNVTNSKTGTVLLLK